MYNSNRIFLLLGRILVFYAVLQHWNRGSWIVDPVVIFYFVFLFFVFCILVFCFLYFCFFVLGSFVRSEQECTSRIFLFCGQLILDNTGLSYSLRASHMKGYSLISHRLLGALATFWEDGQIQVMRKPDNVWWSCGVKHFWWSTLSNLVLFSIFVNYLLDSLQQKPRQQL